MSAYRQNRDAVSWVRTGTEGCKLMHNAIGGYTFPLRSVLYISEIVEDSVVRRNELDRATCNSMQSRGFARITPSFVGLDLHVFLSGFV